MFINHLSLEGFGSYRDKCVLDLGGAQACVIIGDNGSGKSTIFEAVLWVLFGDTRERSADSVLNLESDEANVRLEFVDLDRKVWNVDRGRTRAGRQIARAACDDGRIATGAKEVGQTMGHVLGVDASVLCATAFALQGAAGLFATGGASKRREILQKGMEHIDFATMLDGSRKKEREALAEVAVAEAALVRATELAEKLEPRRERYNTCKREAAGAEKGLREIEDAYSDVRPGSTLAALREARQAASDLENATKNKAKASAALKTSITRVDRLRKTLPGLKEKQQVTEGSAGNTDREAREFAERAAAAEQAAKSAPERLRMLRAGDDSTCWVCSTELAEDQIELLVKEQEALISDAERARKSADRRATTVRRATREAAQARNDVEAAKQEIAEAESDGRRCLDAEEKAGIRMEHFRPKAEILPELEAAAVAEQDKTAMGQRLERAREASRKASEAVGEARRSLREAQRSADSLADLRGEAVRAERAHGHTKLLVKAMSPTGVPQLAMQRRADMISQAANRRLADMGDLQVRFVATDDNSRGMSIHARSIGDVWRPYATFSGGEKMRVDIALRVALCEILQVRSSILVLDEGWGVLDRGGAHQLGKVLHCLIDDDVVQQVFTITHVPTAVDVFPQRIEVSKVDGSSVAQLVTA